MKIFFFSPNIAHLRGLEMVFFRWRFCIFFRFCETRTRRGKKKKIRKKKFFPWKLDWIFDLSSFSLAIFGVDEFRWKFKWEKIGKTHQSQKEGGFQQLCKLHQGGYIYVGATKFRGNFFDTCYFYSCRKRFGFCGFWNWTIFIGQGKKKKNKKILCHK